MRKIKVPKLKQTKLACGPTSLQMVLSYFGMDLDLKEIIKKAGGINKQRGVRCVKLSDFAKLLGFNTECYSFNKKLSKGKARIKKPSKDDILKFLKKGIPVMIAVRAFLLFNKKFSEEGHYIVITKYENKVFWYNDPAKDKECKIKEDDLMFAWHNNILDSSGYFLAIWPKKK
jgi:uncharacterized protein YvpB